MISQVQVRSRSWSCFLQPEDAEGDSEAGVGAGLTHF